MTIPIVVDTSVLISALIGQQGPSREILRQCLQGKYTPLINNSLFFEYEDVISRHHILERCPLEKSEIRELLNAFYLSCTWISIYFLWRPNIQDEGDNFLIELAVAGNASFVVTNNLKDFGSAELVFPNLRVVTPEQMLKGD
jgi:putative PIN family toxin of toxin-antitoxin system